MAWHAVQALKAQNLAQLQEAALASRGSQQTAQEVRNLQTEADAEDKAIAALLSAVDQLKVAVAGLLSCMWKGPWPAPSRGGR